MMTRAASLAGERECRLAAGLWSAAAPTTAGMPSFAEVPASGGVPATAGEFAGVARQSCKAPAAATILELTAIGPDDHWRVGNKAWRLAGLARAGLPVPAGFCITADAFGDDETLPPLQVAAIRAAYRQLGSPRVAVRSSAADEDLAEQSGAGVYTTVLNVSGEAELLAAIRTCRAARPDGSTDAGPSPLALLVQRQVDAEAAGVLFTADPLSGCRDRLVVNVLHGLGEPLASGRASGDTFRLSPDGELLGQTIRVKSRMLTAAGEVPVPPGQRRRPTLTAPELRRLAGMASAVVRHFGPPPGDAATARNDAAAPGLDIEFAFVLGRPILLQARPIPSRLLAATAPSADAAALQDYVHDELQKFAANATLLRTSGRIRGAEIVWSAGNIRELLPTPSRFSFALFSHIFAGRDGAIVQGRRRLGYRLGAQAGEDLFALIGGQPYFNLEIDAATYDAGLALPIEKLLSEVTAHPERANYPELGLYPDTVATMPGGADAAADFRRRMLDRAGAQRRRFAALLRRLDRDSAGGGAKSGDMSNRRLDGLSIAPQPGSTAGAVGPLTVPTPDIATLQNAIAAELRQLRQLGVRFVIAARFGFCFADLARRRLLALSSSQAGGLRRYARLLQGLPGSKITEQTHDLEDLAHGRIDRAAFLARHGHWARNELELSLPRLAENPSQLDAMLAELQAGGRSPRTQFAHQQAQRQRCEKALRRHLATRPEEAAELFAELAAAQHYLPLRESLKYHLAIHYRQLRQLLLQMAQQLGWPADSLFQLEPQEILELPSDPSGRAAALALSQKRRDERTQARRLAQQRPLPAVLFASRPEDIGDAHAIAGQTSKATDDFAAEPIAPGFAEGFVRIIRLDDEAAGCGRVRLSPCAGHEILVAPSANLGLAPLFRSAAGVIVEVGGVLAHCACQAREAGIPALVLTDATRRLRDGDRVSIDAQNGRVVVLARAESRPQEW